MVKIKLKSYICIFCICLSFQTQCIQNSFSWDGNAPIFNWEWDNGVIYQENIINITWWWWDNYNWDLIRQQQAIYPYIDDSFESEDDGIIDNFTLSIKNSIDNRYITILQINDTLLSELPHSVLIDLRDYVSVYTDQSFYLQGFYFISEYGPTFTRTYYQWFIWEYQEEGRGIILDFNIPQVYLYLFFCIGFLVFGFGIYWQYVSCRNVENYELPLCIKKYSLKGTIDIGEEKSKKEKENIIKKELEL
ncbi:MAG: hypothetical protein WC934_02820 [Acidithiobacillus sp.]|jgi:hypothetical protein|uniref:hypothetical protein n=1 Tax=Acidithiobacillus sp. TaxID=1872118 RepID=UPI00355E9D68